LPTLPRATTPRSASPTAPRFKVRCKPFCSRRHRWARPAGPLGHSLQFTRAHVSSIARLEIVERLEQRRGRAEKPRVVLRIHHGAPRTDPQRVWRLHHAALLGNALLLGEEHTAIAVSPRLVLLQASSRRGVIHQHLLIEGKVEECAHIAQLGLCPRDQGLIAHFHVVGDLSALCTSLLNAIRPEGTEIPVVPAWSEPEVTQRDRRVPAIPNNVDKVRLGQESGDNAYAQSVVGCLIAPAQLAKAPRLKIIEATKTLRPGKGVRVVQGRF